MTNKVQKHTVKVTFGNFAVLNYFLIAIIILCVSVCFLILGNNEADLNKNLATPCYQI